MMRSTWKYAVPAGSLLLTGCGGDTHNAPEEQESNPLISETVLADEQATAPVPHTEQSAPELESEPDEGGLSDSDTENADTSTQEADPISDAELLDDSSPDTGEPDAPESRADADPDNDQALSADGPEKVMLVVDGSGSMWGQIDGKTKIEIARDTLPILLNGLPENAETGLIAYGHRRKGDCTDIEVLSAPTAGAEADIIRSVAGITPTGKTPLSFAVKQAAEVLKFEEDKATVILVTDGVETCDLDPCELGAQLEKTGINFTAHIVGFGLSEQEGRQVACLAENTGGYYIEASNADELSNAMIQVVEAVEQEPAPEPERAEATLTIPAEAEIGSVFSVTWTGPDDADRNDYIDLVEPKRAEKVGQQLWWRYLHDKDSLEVRAPAEPGPYLVRYIWQNPPHKPQVIASETIEIVDAGVVLVAPQSVHVGQSFAVTWKGPGNEHDYIDIVPRGVTKTNGQISYRYIEDGNTEGIAERLRAPGDSQEVDVRYVARGSDGRRVLKTVPMTVEEARAEVAFNPTVSLGSTLEVNWTGPQNENDYIDVVERGSNDTNRQLSYRYIRADNPVSLKVPGEVGEYDVRYIMQSADGERILARAPLTILDREVSLDFASTIAQGKVLEVETDGPRSSSNYVDIVEKRVRKTSDQLSYRYARKNEDYLELKLPAEPGEYDVRFILNASNGERVLARKPLTVTQVEASLDAPDEADVDARIEISWEGPGGRSDFIDIVERGKKVPKGSIRTVQVRKSPTVEMKMPDEPGEYDIRYIHVGADKRLVKAVLPIEVK